MKFIKKNKTYSWYRKGHNKRHNTRQNEGDLNDLTDKQIEKLKRGGVPEDYFELKRVTYPVVPNLIYTPIQQMGIPDVLISPPQSFENWYGTEFPSISSPDRNFTSFPSFNNNELNVEIQPIITGAAIIILALTIILIGSAAFT